MCGAVGVHQHNECVNNQTFKSIIACVFVAVSGCSHAAEDHVWCVGWFVCCRSSL